MDTGANKNFIKSHLAPNAKPVHTPFFINSPAGKILVKAKICGKFFSSLGCDLDITFFILPSLESFDGIIGDDTLKQLKAIIDREKN